MLNDLIVICKLSEEELKEYIHKFIKKYYKKNEIIYTEDYIYAKGNIPVMLASHIDTVFKEAPKTIWYSENKDRIKSDEGIGGDDRCGVYAILEIIQSSFKPSVYFATGEESGGVGSYKFIEDVKSLDVNCIIEIDRRGNNDVVRYSDDNEELVKMFINLGYNEKFGSFTDISILCPNYGISGVNLSCGYYMNHSEDEYIVFSELKNTIDKIKLFLSKSSNYALKYEYKQSLKCNYGIFSYYNNYNYCDDETMKCIFCEKSLYENVDEIYETPDGILCEDCFDRFIEYYRICPDCGMITLKDEDCYYCGSKEIEHDDVDDEF